MTIVDSTPAIAFLWPHDLPEYPSGLRVDIPAALGERHLIRNTTVRAFGVARGKTYCGVWFDLGRGVRFEWDAVEAADRCRKCESEHDYLARLDKAFRAW